MPSLKPFSRAKHVGRATTRFSFEMSELCIESGLPTTLSATGLIVQCSRGPKMAATKAIEFTPEMKADLEKKHKMWIEVPRALPPLSLPRRPLVLLVCASPSTRSSPSADGPLTRRRRDGRGRTSTTSPAR